ncbi:hypothetical protein CMU21_15830 [Elizabethkingia anophelis]|nr:hypothetical protein [Elizabethkingia anophelis]
MKFEKKTAAEIAAMSAEEQEKYIAAKEANDKDVRAKEIDDALAPLIKSLKDSNKDVSDIAEIVNQIKEEAKSFNGLVVSEANFLKTIGEKAEEIKEIYNQGSGQIEIMVVPKAVGPIMSSSGTYTQLPALMATQLNPLQRIDLDILDIESEVTSMDTDLSVYTYAYAVPKDGKYDFQTEGEAKKQIDFTWKNGSSSALTFAAWERLTEQAVQDVKGLMNVATGYLKDRHDYDKALAVVFGNDANDIKGIVDYAKPFTAGDLAASVEKPLITDIVGAGILSVRSRRNYPGERPFNPNVAYMNPVDFFKEYTAKKDNYGKPLFPTAQNGYVIIGNTVIKERFEIPSGKILIADLKKVKLFNYKPYTVRIGWVNDDFIKNQFVMLGESRFHLIIQPLDEAAFLYDDIATIKTAITKPETP